MSKVADSFNEFRKDIHNRVKKNKDTEGKMQYKKIYF